MPRYLLVWNIQIDVVGERSSLRSIEETITCKPDDLTAEIAKAKQNLQAKATQTVRESCYDSHIAVSLAQVLPLG